MNRIPELVLTENDYNLCVGSFVPSVGMIGRCTQKLRVDFSLPPTKISGQRSSFHMWNHFVITWVSDNFLLDRNIKVIFPEIQFQNTEIIFGHDLFCDEILYPFMNISQVFGLVSATQYIYKKCSCERHKSKNTENKNKTDLYTETSVYLLNDKSHINIFVRAFKGLMDSNPYYPVFSDQSTFSKSDYPVFSDQLIFSKSDPNQLIFSELENSLIDKHVNLKIGLVINRSKANFIFDEYIIVNVVGRDYIEVIKPRFKITNHQILFGQDRLDTVNNNPEFENNTTNFPYITQKINSDQYQNYVTASNPYEFPF